MQVSRGSAFSRWHWNLLWLDRCSCKHSSDVEEENRVAFVNHVFPTLLPTLAHTTCTLATPPATHAFGHCVKRPHPPTWMGNLIGPESLLPLHTLAERIASRGWGSVHGESGGMDTGHIWRVFIWLSLILLKFIKELSWHMVSCRAWRPDVSVVCDCAPIATEL